jgi:hypothetical protein
MLIVKSHILFESVTKLPLGRTVCPHEIESSVQASDSIIRSAKWHKKSAGPAVLLSVPKSYQNFRITRHIRQPNPIQHSQAAITYPESITKSISTNPTEEAFQLTIITVGISRLSNTMCAVGSCARVCKIENCRAIFPWSSDRFYLHVRMDCNKKLAGLPFVVQVVDTQNMDRACPRHDGSRKRK